MQDLKGVGTRVAELLSHLNIYVIQDLLFHLPLRYEDRTKITAISQLREGDRVMIQGHIQNVSIVGRKRASLICNFADDTGSVILRFFHFNNAQRQRLAESNVQLRCFGEVRRGYLGGYLAGFEMVHPEYRYLEQAHELPLSDHLTPVYPTTKGLQQTVLRKLINQAFDLLKNDSMLIELLPPALLQKLQLPTLIDAITFLHHPPPDLEATKIQDHKNLHNKRLIIEELLAHQLSLQKLRKEIKSETAPALSGDSKFRTNLLQNLPFQLTQAQQRVISEILQDLAQAKPMLRLLQGDVGSGKTIVAALITLQAVEQGYQVALMAPTELLAEQHYQNFVAWLTPLDIKVGILTSKTNGRERTNLMEKISGHHYQIIIGTHALFQQDVKFARLGLLVIDEQHRFGVQQRLALKDKGKFLGIHPHQLIMTATPIPRTLAMVAYADLDFSIIDELPPDRKPISTLLIPNSKRQKVIERVQANCKMQRQAYWVCTLIDESEVLTCQAAQVTADELQKLLTDVKVGLVHGRLKADEKELLMNQFKKGEIDLLVSTTVIEVGIDVPNASLMIIENAERLGLAQLHQLRGRVGRGKAESYCVLLYQTPLSQTARKRLTTMRYNQDGLEIARQDLEMRGPGEVFGVRQAGLAQLKIANIARDQYLFEEIQSIGNILLYNYPELVELLIKRWLHGAQHYIEV